MAEQITDWRKAKEPMERMIWMDHDADGDNMQVRCTGWVNGLMPVGDQTKKAMPSHLDS